jgi:hypothetical protein
MLAAQLGKNFLFAVSIKTLEDNGQAQRLFN